MFYIRVYRDKDKRLKLKSKAFTLFEVLVSLVILSVMILSLTKLYTRDDSIQTYYELQSIENSYIETGATADTENIKLKHN